MIEFLRHWLNYPAHNAWLLAIIGLAILGTWVLLTIIAEEREHNTAQKLGENARRLSEAWDEYYRLAAHNTEVFDSKGSRVVQCVRGRTGTDGALYLMGQESPQLTKSGCYAIACPVVWRIEPGEFTSFVVRDGEGKQV
jgi:hypothetical protein